MAKEKSEKNWFRRHWLLTGILALILLIIVSNTASQSEEGEDYICPELSQIQLLAENVYMDGYWSAKTYEYENIIYDSESLGVITCQEGDDEGQNPNYVYCGDSIYQIKLNILNQDGTIKDQIGVQVVFDKNTKEYIKTVCDAYSVW